MDAREVTIVWNGGWDDLEINLDDIRPLTEAELVERLGDPFLGSGYLRCSFLKGELESSETAVAILRKINSGD